MRQENCMSALILGASIFMGLTVFGYLLSGAAIHFKEYERSVTAKGLSEREMPTDIIIWPIVFTEAGNELGSLYASIDANTKKIKDFLVAKGISITDITAAVQYPTMTV